MSGTQKFWDALFNRPDDNRLQQLEAKVNAIFDHLGLEHAELATPLSDEVKALAEQPRKKFAAVKLHRQQTGVALREAEAAVAAHIRSRRKPKRPARA